MVFNRILSSHSKHLVFHDLSETEREVNAENENKIFKDYEVQLGTGICLD